MDEFDVIMRKICKEFIEVIMYKEAEIRWLRSLLPDQTPTFKELIKDDVCTASFFIVKAIPEIIKVTETVTEKLNEQT